MEMDQPMRIFCKMNKDLNVAVRGDQLLLVPADSSDKSQHWLQDYSAVGRLTDIEGRRAFALVSRTTGQAMVNEADYVSAVTLAPYSRILAVEVSKLWSLGERDEDGFSNVRVLQNIGYNLNGYGGAKDGTVVGIYYGYTDAHNSLWKIVGIDQE